MKKTNKSMKIRNKTVIFGFVSIAAFTIFLKYSDIAIEYMKKGLELCATSVIPSLFPFMVISELIVKSSIINKIGGFMKRPMNTLFGIGEASGCAFILGTLCGFPIGAKTAVSMYDAGAIQKNELERLLCFCNNPGSAFVISAVGISLFNSRQIGNILYVCVILSSITVGIFLNIFSHKTKKAPAPKANIANSDTDTFSIFTSAVASSAISMLTVCAYIVFFSALVGCIKSFFCSIALPDIFGTFLFGFFEITSGVRATTSIKNIEAALILCSAFIAWSGLSVHCQIITICSGRGISFKKYFIAKAIQGLVCAFFTGISLRFLFPNILPDASDVFVSTKSLHLMISPAFFCICFFLASIAVLFFHVLQKKRI